MTASFIFGFNYASDITVTFGRSCYVTLNYMDIRVWNRAKKDLRPDPFFSLADFKECGLYFETCLRRLWIEVGHGHERHSPPDVSGADAYAFLLKVLCGLDSPFLGETEVLGQFREQSRSAPRAFEIPLQKLYQDVKLVRSKWLTGIGSVSYGGIARSLLKTTDEIVLVGAGSLGLEIAQWLGKDTQKLKWFASRPRQIDGRDILTWNPTAISPGSSLVIAAPLQSPHFEGIPSLQHVLDFRPGGAFNGTADRVFTFEDIKILAQENRKLHEFRLNEAVQMINGIALERFLEAKTRPFGWEDLCG